MSEAVPSQGLFESHLPVVDLARSVAFYREVVGLELAHEVPERGAAFLWCGGPGKSMLGLWSIGSIPMGISLHIALRVELADLLAAPRHLEEHGIQALSFFTEPATEPSVIGWMPAAAIYFRDPDGHHLEYLAMLDGQPRPDLGVIAWSDWRDADGGATGPR
jgi:lactoylglutathione lyase